MKAPPEHTFATFTADDLASLAAQDNATVMTHAYDYHQPWDGKRVEEAAERVAALAVRLGDSSAVRAEVEKDEELSQFSRSHPTLSAKLSDPSVAGNEKHMRVVRFMIAAHARVRGGEIAESEARSGVSAFALRSLGHAPCRSESGASAGGGKER